MSNGFPVMTKEDADVVQRFLDLALDAARRGDPVPTQVMLRHETPGGYVVEVSVPLARLVLTIRQAEIEHR